MKEPKNNFYEKIYFRGVMIWQEGFTSIFSAKNYFRFDFKGKKKISGADNYFCIIKHRSKISPPRYFLSRPQNNIEDEYIFPFCCIDVQISENRKALLFSAPNRDLLEENLPKERNINYVRCNLKKICFDKYKGSNSKIQLTRLNGRFTSEFGQDVTSIALFGADVVTNKFILDVLDIKAIDKNVGNLNPFSGPEIVSNTKLKSVQKRNIIPNSCRIKYDDGSNNPAALNIDAFGNYSFYVQNEDTFKGINFIFEYIKSINAFEADVTFDPLKRSDRALELIS